MASAGIAAHLRKRGDEKAWVVGVTSPAGIEAMFAVQADYFAGLTDPDLVFAEPPAQDGEQPSAPDWLTVLGVSERCGPGSRIAFARRSWAERRLPRQQVDKSAWHPGLSVNRAGSNGWEVTQVMPVAHQLWFSPLHGSSRCETAGCGQSDLRPSALSVEPSSRGAHRIWKSTIEAT